MVTPSGRRQMAHRAVLEKGISIHLACLIFTISETCYRYQAKLSDENAKIADWLLRLTQTCRYRLFNVIDDFNREGLGIEVDFSLPSERVIRALNQIIQWRGKPKQLRCDNGPEYVSKTLANCARENSIEIKFIQPGNPQQNAYIERYNRTVRYDWLNQHLFSSIAEVQDHATRWLWTYNNERPNMAIGGVLPMRLITLVT